MPGHAELEPIHERRPAEVVEAIERRFHTLQTEFPDGYNQHGTKDHYEFWPALSTTTLVAALRRQKDSIRVLDVGAGAGAFISRSDWRADDVVHGLSAYDYRQDERAQHTGLASRGSGRYIIGDAERLDETPGILPEYDLVVTRWLMRHMIDPLGTFEQISNRVAASGIFAFDNFRWRNQDGSHAIPVETVTECLEVAGFTVNTDADPLYKKLLRDLRGFSTMPSMVLRREENTKPVRIPVTPFMDKHLRTPSAYYRASYRFI